MIEPVWIGVGITVGGIIFTSGGVVAGMKINSNNNNKCHDGFQKQLDHLDDIKQTTIVCDERHKNIEEDVKEIKKYVLWLVKNQNGGHAIE